MKLFHGTASSNVALIQASGILPHNRKGTWPWKAHPEFVYLTNDKTCAWYFAVRAAIIHQCSAALITVDIDEKLLYPDENFYIPGETSLSIETYELAQYTARNNKGDWQLSLLHTNLVSHLGQVTATQISNVDVRDIRDTPYANSTKSLLRLV